MYTAAAGTRRYLLVRSNEGFWGFPKGHVEAGETERETAAREIREETGLCVRFVDGFREETAYRLVRGGAPAVQKRVVYVLAEYKNQRYRAQKAEISDIALLDFTAALSALHADDLRRVLKAAHTFLEKTLCTSS